MKPIAIIEDRGVVVADIVAAPSHEDCLSLCRYLEKYWKAEIKEVYDTGFAAKFEIVMPGRTAFLVHDSQTGNSLTADSSRVDEVVPDIIEDLRARLAD